MEEKMFERVLKVKRGDMERTITHIHWQSWPDHGVPSNDLSPLVLLQRVRQSQFPIVVHCSAGVGRTGSVVAIEYVLERIIYKQPCDDMVEVVTNLRKQRAYSIQTELQYLYVHCILLRYYTELKYISMEDANLVQFLEEYEQLVGRLNPK
uniref:Protein-tyrosine-phosphatase n=1 Tax=Steinernema glaseri TaxID=37863 RepID=A0A1I8AJ26_9BILA